MREREDAEVGGEMDAVSECFPSGEYRPLILLQEVRRMPQCYDGWLAMLPVSRAIR